MNNFIRYFERGPDGMWTCVLSADLETVQGRVQVTSGTRFAPGTLFMGIDLVGMLEHELHRRNSHASPPISQPPKTPYMIRLPLRAAPLKPERRPG
jgi:hypothetical protein